MLWWLVDTTPWVCFKEHSYHSYDFVELASFFNSDVNNSAHFNLLRDKSGFELRSDVCSFQSHHQNQVACECLKHWTLDRFTLGSQGPSFFLFMDVEKKIGLESPKLHTQGPTGTARAALGSMPMPTKTAKNRRILILRAHVSPHLGAEAWAQVVVALATRRLRTK